MFVLVYIQQPDSVTHERVSTLVWFFSHVGITECRADFHVLDSRCVLIHILYVLLGIC